MKKGKRRLLLISVAVILLIGLVLVIRPRNGREETLLKTSRVGRGTITLSVSGTGILEPFTTVEVKSNVGGQIVFLGVDEGDTVKAGQVVARIDPSDAASILEQSQADLDSARSKVKQADYNLAMQRAQYPAQVHSAEQAVAVAQARLAQAQKEAKLQPSLVEASIAQARSSLASAKADLQQVKSATIPQKVAAARTALEQARANYSYAGDLLNRKKALLAKGFVAQSEVDAARQQYEISRAQLDSAGEKSRTIGDETAQDLQAAQARLAQAEASLRSAEANSALTSVKQDDVASARASLRQAKAALASTRAASYQTSVRAADITQAQAQVKRSAATVANARTGLAYTTITAPRAGIVMTKYVEEGSIVAGGRSSSIGAGEGVALLEIADVSRMHAIVNVDETDIAQIRLGQEVNISVDAYPDDSFVGSVTKISPKTVTEQNVTTIPVTVEVEAPDLRLKPGMNATCDFVTERRSDVLMVPNKAVRNSRSGATVTVLEEGKPVVRKVKRGLSDSDNTEVLSGLREDEVVVTEVTGRRGRDAAGGSSGRSPSGDRTFGRGSSGGSRRMGGPGGMPPM